MGAMGLNLGVPRPLERACEEADNAGEQELAVSRHGGVVSLSSFPAFRLLGPGGMSMTPRITTCATFTIMGVASRIGRGSETSDLFVGIWKAFESRRQEIASIATPKVYFGVNFPTADDRVTDYVAGMRVPPDAAALEGLETRDVPGGEYAVFECALDAIGATYQHVFAVWLPSAPVQFDPGRAPFEEYPESTLEQPVRLHIPVRRQRAAGELASLQSVSAS
jgi:predicted transcriptional regulator YdeE